MKQTNLSTVLKQSMLPAVAGALLLSASFTANANNAVLSIDPETQCFDLMAGQNIDAGDVCLSIDGENLVVDYQTQDGWMLGETHTWAGEFADDYPQNKKGNPKIGNFPYNSGNIEWVDNYSVSIPLYSFTDTFADLNALCGVELSPFYVMAHAVVGMGNDISGYQTETGWSDGDRVVDRGSWATRSSFNFVVTCDDDPDGPGDDGYRGGETAWVVGETEFTSLLSCGADDIRGTDDENNVGSLSSKWGWSVGPIMAGATGTYPIYAAAGQNVLTKGSHIGNATITFDGAAGEVDIDVQIFEDYGFKKIQIFVGDNHTCTVAPGQLGYQEEFETEQQSYSVTRSFTGTEAYLAIHFESFGDCVTEEDGGNGNFCPKQEESTSSE
ncbi:hypothetical protein [Oceanospirillum sanctuarii]|uniref:hypothetical protein n=1 Tax=Oceanospirillum sanctuarii TaxID=1434821 RepID=UPI00111E1B6C|nr:hypothetical protein [Oceanospirillum sanctuarii]